MPELPPIPSSPPSSAFQICSDVPPLPLHSDDVMLPSSPPPRASAMAIPSSPPRFAVANSSRDHQSLPSSAKVKRPPPITPRRFQRFFTPRSALRENPNLSSKSGRGSNGVGNGGLNGGHHGDLATKQRWTAPGTLMTPSAAVKDTYYPSSPPRPMASDAFTLCTSDDIENIPSTPCRSATNVLDTVGGEEEEVDDESDDEGELEGGQVQKLPSSILITPTKRRRLQLEFPPSSPVDTNSGPLLASSPLRRFHTHSNPYNRHDEQSTNDYGKSLFTSAALRQPNPPSTQSAPPEHAATPVQRGDADANPQATSIAPPKLRRSRALHDPGNAQLLVRTLGRARHNLHPMVYPGFSNGWQDDVENFYSAIDDTHSCTQPNEEWLALPLCTAACNTTSLLAVGEESGQVRLLNPSPGKFATPRFTCSVHNNAILDLAFSASDTKLATASGDQTARVVDMSTQQTTAVLQRHSSSLKKVCWKDDSQEQVLATCSRDGAVAIWDLRVKCSTSRPVLEVGDSATDDESRLDALQQSPGGRGRRGLIVKEYTQPLNFIAGAHSDRVRVRLPYAPSQHGNAAPLPCPTVSDSAPTPPGDTSVTSLLFLPAPRSNLLVTSGASDACLRLWDLRTTYALRRRVPVPLAVTRQPSSHSRNRQFGITSMDLNTDGSRLYALCRDRTVYVYSTRHLAIEGAGEERLGGADSGAFKHFPGEEARMGLGPLYGLRHPRLSVSSFFVKLAVRREGSGRREVLAVGSSDNCAVVFSTDERYMRQREASSVDGVDREERDKSMGYRADATQSPLTPSTPSRRSTLRPSTLSQSPNKHTSMLPTPTSDARQRRGPGMSSSPYYASSASQRRCQNKGCTASEDQLPIYSPGVALSGAHKKEVSVVCFTRSGELITVSDDFSARCWREDSKEAWEVRTYGAAEAGGTAGGVGWVEFADGQQGGSGWPETEGRDVGGLFSDTTVPLSQCSN